MKLNLRTMLGLRPTPPRRADRDPFAEARAQAALIDQLMAGPIKERPQITVFGDDAVTGINPAPRNSPRA